MPPGPKGFRTHLPWVRAGPLRKEGSATCSPHSGTSSYPLPEPGALNQTGRAEAWAARPVGAHGPQGSPAGLQVGAGDQEVIMGLSTLGTPGQAGGSGLEAQGSVPGGVGSDRGLTVRPGRGGLVHVASYQLLCARVIMHMVPAVHQTRQPLPLQDGPPAASSEPACAPGSWTPDI